VNRKELEPGFRIMKRGVLCLILALLIGCAKVRAITDVPEI
jgi:hypothetical protein